MDFKKRKRDHCSDGKGEEEDERPKVNVFHGTREIRQYFVVQSKRGLVVVPSPPSPPGDSNDREVSMILGQGERKEMKEKSQYSQHSSLLTDLSLTPSPKECSVPQDSLSTPTNLSEPDQVEPGLESDSLDGFTEQPETQQPAVYKKPDNPQNSIPSEERSTCLNTTEVQEESADDQSSQAKASSINNNSSSVQDVILSCISENISVTSPEYCSPSPVFSIPSPGSAFSIVISKRRDSES